MPPNPILELDFSSFQKAKSFKVSVENQNLKIIWPKRPIFVKDIALKVFYDPSNPSMLEESDLDLNFSKFSSLKTVDLEL